MQIKHFSMAITLALLLLSCGDDKQKIDGGYFGDVPSILVNQATDREEIMQKAKTEAESTDDLVKLNSESEKLQQEYQSQLDEALKQLGNVDIRYTIEQSDYEMENPPVMTVEQSSSNTCRAIITFSLKTKTAIKTKAYGSYVKTYGHNLYFKFVDNEGNAIHKRMYSLMDKIGEEKFGDTLAAGTIIPCELSISLGADKEEQDGKTIFVCPEAKIDQMVVISQLEYDELSPSS